MGRPNVGKSTLFNKLTNSRDALVADVPGSRGIGATAVCNIAGRRVTLIDTGGMFGEDALNQALTEQTELAVAEADVVVVLFDGRAGITAPTMTWWTTSAAPTSPSCPWSTRSTA